MGFVDHFGSADKAITQVLYLSILNFLSISLILSFKNERIQFINSLNKNLLFKVMFLFILWASASIIFAVNKMESLRVLTDLIAYIFSIGILLRNLSRPPFLNVTTPPMPNLKFKSQTFKA